MSLQWTIPLLDPNVSVLQPEFFAPDPIGENADAWPQRGEAQPWTPTSITSTVSMSPGLAPRTRIGPVAGLTKGSVMSEMAKLLVERMDEMAADIELGFDLENLVGTDLGNEGIGRRQAHISDRPFG